MPVQLHSSRVLLTGGLVAIDSDCCCGGGETGACCHGTTCDIETETDCIGSGGVYQGDGTDCDPNPCGGVLPSCPCSFFHDGRYYLTRRHLNTPTTNCPPGQTGILFDDGNHVDSVCAPTTFAAPACFTAGSRLRHLLSTQTYNEFCGIDSVFVDVSVSTYCSCFDGNSTFDPDTCPEHGGVIMADCPCPPEVDPCDDPPPGAFHDCTFIDTLTVVYENECIPT